MADRKPRKRSLGTSDTNQRQNNKENIGRDSRFEGSKDAIQKLAEQQLNQISEFDHKRTDFSTKVQKNVHEDISAWNQSPVKRTSFRSTSELKPKSASVRRTAVRQANSMGLKQTSTKPCMVETVGQEVLVYKPVVTQPADIDTFNVIFQQKALEQIVSCSEQKTRQRHTPSKLHEIIKFIEVENSKLLRKLFRQKTIFMETSNKKFDRRASLRSAHRPASGIKKQKSKERITQKTEQSNPDSNFNFILCSQKGIIPASIRPSKGGLRRKQAFDLGYETGSIFYPTNIHSNRFTLRSKMLANSYGRPK